MLAGYPWDLRFHSAPRCTEKQILQLPSLFLTLSTALYILYIFYAGTVRYGYIMCFVIPMLLNGTYQRRIFDILIYLQAPQWLRYHRYLQVLEIHKYFFLIRICRSVILNYGSGSRRPINYEHGQIRILSVHFVVTEKKICCQIRKVPIVSVPVRYRVPYLNKIKYWTFFLKLLWIFDN
jgi:hypothetical protein